MKYRNPLLSLNYFLSCSQLKNEISFDPTLSLLKDNQELDLVLSSESNSDTYINYIYFNRKNIYDILFDEESNINIERIIKKDVNSHRLEVFLYYLCLLIEENKDIAYFIYPSAFLKKICLDFIKNIKENNNENNIYANIIFAKILITLINNLKLSDNINSNRDFGIMQNDIEKIIQTNLEKLQEINLVMHKEEIITKNLEDIYYDIIRAILIMESRDKYDKALNILTQMNLDEINMINGNTYHKMKLLLSEKKFKRQYLIQNVEDFHDQDKINIYFILFKYIFKNGLYIYQIPFLLEARNVLLKNLRKNEQQVFNNEINNLTYVIARLLDTEYYIDKYIKNKEEIYIQHIQPEKEVIKEKEIKDDEYNNLKEENKENENTYYEDLNEVLTYYKNYKPESKREDIIKIETSLGNKENVNFKEYLNDLAEAKYLNPRYSLIKFFYSYNNKNQPLTEKKLEKEVNAFKKQEKVLLDTNFNKMTTCKTFFEFFKNPENTELVIKLYSKDLYDLFMTFNKLKEVLNYYKRYFPESKEQDIKIIDKLTKNKTFNKENIELYLKDYETAEKMNIRHIIIHKLSKVGIKEEKISEERINEIADKWNNYIEQSIIEKSSNYDELSKPLLNELSEIFKNKSKEETLLKIFSIDAIEFFRNLKFDKNDMPVQKEKIEEKDEIIIENKKAEISNDNIKNSEIINDVSFSDANQSKEINIDDLSVLEETSYKTKVLNYLNKNKEKINLSEYNEDEKLLMFDIFADINNIDETSIDKIKNIPNKYAKMKKAIKEGKKNKLGKDIVKETYNYFINEKNKEKLLKTFTQEDIDFLINLNTSKHKKPVNQLEPEIINKLEEVKQYFNNFYPEKRGDIDKIEQIIKEQNKNDEKINEYLKEYDEAKRMNIRYPPIAYLFKIKQKERGVKFIKDVISGYEEIEKLIKENRFRRLKEKKNLKEYFKKEENKEVLLKIFSEEQINNFLNEKNSSIINMNSKIKEEPRKPVEEKLSIEIINNLEIILKYYKNYYFESKKEDIDLIEKNIKLREKFEYEKYLIDLEDAKKRNDKYPIIKFIYEYNYKGKEIKEKELLILLEIFESSEKPIGDGKKNKIIKQIKLPIIEYFNNEENIPILLKVFTQEQIDKFIEKKGQKEKKELKEQKKLKISKEIINKLKEILNYYNNYFFESKAKEIIELNDIIKNEQGEYEKYLKEEEIAKEMNIRYPLVRICENKNNSNDKNEKHITECKSAWNKYEDMIKRKKFSKKIPPIISRLLFKYFNDENNKDRLLQIFTEDEYEYFKDENNHPKKKKEKISEENLNKLNIVLNYYKNYEFQSKKDDITFLENGIKKGEEFEYKKYLENLQKYEDMNDRYPIIEFLLLKNNKEKTEKDLNQIIKNFNTDEKLIKGKKKNKFIQNRKLQLLEYFNNNDNREILLKIFTQDQIDDFIENNKEKISEENINKLKEIETYYNNYFFETKKKEINDLKEIIRNQQGDYKKYLQDEEEAKKMNIRYPLICKIYENKYDINNKKEEQFTSSKKTWLEKYEDMIRRKAFNKMPAGIKDILLKYFNDENNKDRLLKIFKKDEYEYFKDENNHPKKKKEKISVENLNKLNIVLNYYKNYLFNTKKEQIIFLEKAINKGEEFDYKEYLENLEVMKKANDRFPIVEFLFMKEKNTEKTEEELKNLLSSFESNEKSIKDGKKKKYKKLRKDNLLEYFNNDDNKEILIKIFTQEQIDNFKEQNEKISVENINTLKEILVYYNNYLFTSKTKEIAELTNIIKNEQGNYKKYLKEEEVAKTMNIRYPLICLLSNYNPTEKNEILLQKNIEAWKKYEDMIKEKKSFKKMPKSIREKLDDYFNNEENKDLLLKIFGKEIYEYFKEEIKQQKKKKITKEEINQLTIVLNYYKNYFFETKKEEIIIIEKAIKNEHVDYQKFLNDLDKSTKMNEKYPIIEYLSNSIDNKNIKERTEEDVKTLLDNFEKIEKIIKEKNNEEIPLDLEKMAYSLFSFFKDENNKEIIFKLFNEEEIKIFLSKEKINEENIYKLEIILNYYQKYFFESKKDDIENLKEIIKNKKGEYKNYLPDLDIAENLNLRYPLINCLIEEKEEITEHDYSEAIQQWQENEEMIKSKSSLIKMKKRKLLFKYLLKDDNNQKILSDIFEKDAVDNLLKIFNEYKNKYEVKNKLKEVLLYYKVFHPESKSDDIIILEGLLNKGLVPGYEIYLLDYENAKKMNKQSSIVQYLCGSDNKSDEKVKKNLDFLDTFQNLMKDGKFNKIKKGHKRLLLKYMEKEEKGETPNKYFTKEQIDMLKEKS